MFSAAARDRNSGPEQTFTDCRQNEHSY